MSNFLIFCIFQMIFTLNVIYVIKAGFHRARLIYIQVRTDSISAKSYVKNFGGISKLRPFPKENLA